jgi:hypothetical protein
MYIPLSDGEKKKPRSLTQFWFPTIGVPLIKYCVFGLEEPKYKT